MNPRQYGLRAGLRMMPGWAAALICAGQVAALAQISPCGLGQQLGNGAVITSGSPSYSSPTYVSAGDLSVNVAGGSVAGSASLTIQAGTAICLGPGFQAAGTGSGGGFTATVGGTPPVGSFAITTTSLPSLNADTLTPYSLPLAASGGVAPYTWSVSAFSTPPGMTLTTTGVITGTPVAAGLWLLGVQAKDATGAVATAQLTLTVERLPSVTVNGVPGSGQVLPNVTIPLSFAIYDGAGAGDVAYAQFYLADSAGNPYCYGDWGRPNALDLYDGATGVTYGFGVNQADSFCRVSLASITNSPTDPTEVTVVLNFMFDPGYAGAYTVMEQVNYVSGSGTEWQDVGSLTIEPPAVSVQLTDTSSPGSTNIYQAGDSYSITVNGPPNQPVTVSQDGASAVPAENTQGSSATNSQGVWTTTGVWALTDVGNYTQVWYVGGVQAVPGLSFQVSNGPGTYTCGFISPQHIEVGQGTPQMFMVNVAGVGATATVGFQVTGSTANPYGATVPATQMPNSSTWASTLSTNALLGPYSVTPVIVPSGGGAQTSCGKQVAFLEVYINTPAPGGPANCASMTGTWTDTVPGGPALFVWNGLSMAGDGTVSGNDVAGSYCGTKFTWSTVSGRYNQANASYSLSASNPSPASYTCLGQQLATGGISTAGTLQSASGGPQAGQCGLGTGTFTGALSKSDSLTTERIPSGESSAGPPAAGWGDAYGLPTTGVFNMAVMSPGGSSYNFGGRWVQEQNPTPGDPSVPASYAGSDGCIWPNGPWTKPFTSLASSDIWNVQGSASGGTYGPDYIGILAPEIVAITQSFNPTVSAGGYCTIQYPQKMVINQESVLQQNPSQQESYGTPGFGVNLLMLTIWSTNSSTCPACVTVMRGNVTEIRTFHF